MKFNLPMLLLSAVQMPLTFYEILPNKKGYFAWLLKLIYGYAKVSRHERGGIISIILSRVSDFTHQNH